MVELNIAKEINRADKIIGKAKKEVIIALGGENPQNYLPSIDAIKQAQSKMVQFTILQGQDVKLSGPSFELLQRDAIRATAPLRVSFILVDGKNFIIQEKTRLGDRLNGSYLRDKFLEVHRKLLPPIPSYT
jgi:hypothetical protein